MHNFNRRVIKINIILCTPGDNHHENQATFK